MKLIPIEGRSAQREYCKLGRFSALAAARRSSDSSGYGRRFPTRSEHSTFVITNREKRSSEVAPLFSDRVDGVVRRGFDTRKSVSQTVSMTSVPSLRIAPQSHQKGALHFS
jgi:hypothetical protein